MEGSLGLPSDGASCTSLSHEEAQQVISSEVQEPRLPQRSNCKPASVLSARGSRL